MAFLKISEKLFEVIDLVESDAVINEIISFIIPGLGQAMRDTNSGEQYFLFKSHELKNTQFLEMVR